MYMYDGFRTITNNLNHILKALFPFLLIFYNQYHKYFFDTYLE